MSYYYPDTFTPFPMSNVGDAGHEMYSNTDQDPAPAVPVAESTDNWMQYNDSYYYAPAHNVPVGVNERTFGQQSMLATGTKTSLGYKAEPSSSSFTGTIPAYPLAEQAYEGNTVEGAAPPNLHPSSWTGPQCATASAFEHYPYAATEGYTNWFPSLSYGRDEHYNQMESGIIYPSYQEMMTSPSFLSGTCTQAESQVSQSSAFGPFAHLDSAYTACGQSFGYGPGTHSTAPPFEIQSLAHPHYSSYLSCSHDSPFTDASTPSTAKSPEPDGHGSEPSHVPQDPQADINRLQHMSLDSCVNSQVCEIYNIYQEMPKHSTTPVNGVVAGSSNHLSGDHAAPSRVSERDNSGSNHRAQNAGTSTRAWRHSCDYEGCDRTFGSISTKRRHMKEMHYETKMWFCPGAKIKGKNKKDRCKCPDEGFNCQRNLLRHLRYRGEDSHCYQLAVCLGWDPSPKKRNSLADYLLPTSSSSPSFPTS